MIGFVLTEKGEMMDDIIIWQQDAIKALRKHIDKSAKGDIGSFYNTIIQRCIEWIEQVPSAQPEIKPIDYRDCANAMLKMWMLDVVTDGEYYRIMDKLNKHELERRNDG